MFRTVINPIKNFDDNIIGEIESTYEDDTILFSHSKNFVKGTSTREKYKNGALYMVTKLNKDGVIHADDDKPAVYLFDADGHVIREVYYKEGKKHRDGINFADISYRYVDGKKIIKRGLLFHNGVKSDLKPVTAAKSLKKSKPLKAGPSLD